jgi:hypothetical protein
VSSKVTVLPGQETLVASWSTWRSCHGRAVIRSPAAVAAVFPVAPLNNAIMLNALRAKPQRPRHPS